MTAPGKIDFSRIGVVPSADPDGLGEAMLGKLIFTNITENDIRVTPDALAAYFEHYEIDPSFLPKPIDPRKQVYKVLRTFPKGKDRRKKLLATGETEAATYEVKFGEPQDKEGGAIHAPLARHLYRDAAERRRTGKPEWETVTVGGVGWIPDDPDKLIFEADARFADEYPYEEIMAQAQEEFIDRVTHYTGNDIRDVVTSVLKKAMGVHARPKGGVWVVMRDDLPLVERVRDMVMLLAAEHERLMADAGESDEDEVIVDGEYGGPVEFNMLVVIDTNEERAFIRGRVETQVIKDLNNAFAAVRKILEAGETPTGQELARFLAAREAALELRDHWSGVIGGELNRIETALEVGDKLYFAAERARRNAR